MHSKSNPLEPIELTYYDYVVNPHAIDRDEISHWYHLSRENEDDFELRHMGDADTKFPAMYLSSTVTSLLNLQGGGETIVVVNLRNGKYFNAQDTTQEEVDSIFNCLSKSIQKRGVPLEDAEELARHQMLRFRARELWYWMEATPVEASTTYEINPKYTHRCSSGNKYYFTRDYPQWKIPPIFIDCLRSLGYDGWFEAQEDRFHHQITVAVLNPLEKVDINWTLSLDMAEHLAHEFP